MTDEDVRKLLESTQKRVAEGDTSSSGDTSKQEENKEKTEKQNEAATSSSGDTSKQEENKEKTEKQNEAAKEDLQKEACVEEGDEKDDSKKGTDCEEGISGFAPYMLEILKASNFNEEQDKKRQRLKMNYICEPCAFDTESQEMFDFNSVQNLKYHLKSGHGADTKEFKPNRHHICRQCRLVFDDYYHQLIHRFGHDDNYCVHCQIFIPDKLKLQRHELKCAGSGDNSTTKTAKTVQKVCSAVPVSVKVTPVEVKAEAETEALDRRPKRGTKGKYL